MAAAYPANSLAMNTADKPALQHAALARVLLAEDDPTSRAFLSTVVRAIPAEVDCADSLAAALALAEAQSHDLWLLDAHLPDGSGIDLLARLQARHPGVPALAHTASTEPAMHTALIAAGFAEVLVKPLAAFALRVAVERALGLSESDGAATDAAGFADGGLPLWDDEAAARAMNFNPGHIDALRRLFLDELPHARRTVVDAARNGDRAAMDAGLHKLRASCGFVGAARLAASVATLRQQPDCPVSLACFNEVARATAAGAAQSSGVVSAVDPASGDAGPSPD